MRKYFPDDDNQILRDIQFSGFHEMAPYLFSRPGQIYMKAAELLNVQDELYEYIRKVIWTSGYDLSVLVPIYELISAFYRYKYNPHGQLLLPLDNEGPFDKTLQQDWANFYYLQVDELSEEKENVRLLISSVVYLGKEIGQSAIWYLESQLITGKYKMLPKKKEILPELIIEENKVIEKKVGRYWSKEKIPSELSYKNN